MQPAVLRVSGAPRPPPTRHCRADVHPTAHSFAAKSNKDRGLRGGPVSTARHDDRAVVARRSEMGHVAPLMLIGRG